MVDLGKTIDGLKGQDAQGLDRLVNAALAGRHLRQQIPQRLLVHRDAPSREHTSRCENQAMCKRRYA